MNKKILVCEDDAATSAALTDFLAADGWAVVTASDASGAIAAYARTMPDAVLLDLRLTEGSGFDVLEHIHSIEPGLPVVVLTADARIDTAVDAARQGASSYLVKPFDGKKLAAELALLCARRPPPSAPSHGALIGASAPMRRLFVALSRLERVSAPTVLITGETGTGKDVVAHTIHERGPRREMPFLAVDCAALPEALIESELFGHERGSFTDAHAQKHGLFELAEGGTIFLDEVGELALGTQAKLLRAIDSRTFRRVGGAVDCTLDAAIIAATNRDLAEHVKIGLFRQDLFFRLNVIPLEVPPLGDRGDDIALLAAALVRDLGRELGRAIDDLTPAALEVLRTHSWPGNVRELKNVLRRAAILKRDDGPIDSVDLSLDVRRQHASMAGAVSLPFDIELPEEGVDIAAVEKALLEQALARSNGNLTRGAQLLRLSRFAFRYRLEKHGLYVRRSAPI